MTLPGLVAANNLSDVVNRERAWDNLGSSVSTNIPLSSPSLDLNFAANKSLVDDISGNNLITFSRASTGTFVGSDGLIQTAASGVPRFDHDLVTGKSLGLLVEEARTNALTYSDTFTDASWTKTNCLITGNSTTAPDGTISASTLSSSAAGTSLVYKTLTQNPSTFSIYLKANTSTVAHLRILSNVVGRNVAYNINLSAGTISAATGNTGSLTGWTEYTSIQNAGNGWYRVSLGLSSTSNPTSTYEISPSTNKSAAASGESIYIWGAQAEAAIFPTSYIPTAASTVTRAADVASITGTNFSSWYNQAAGSIISELRFANTIQAAVLGPVNSGGSDISEGLLVLAGTTQLRVVNYLDQGSTNNDIIRNTPPMGLNKVAVAGSIGDDTTGAAFNGFSNGSVSASRSQAFANVAGLKIGERSGQRITGAIARLTYYPVRLPDLALEFITSASGSPSSTTYPYTFTVKGKDTLALNECKNASVRDFVFIKGLSAPAQPRLTTAAQQAASGTALRDLALLRNAPSSEGDYFVPRGVFDGGTLKINGIQAASLSSSAFSGSTALFPISIRTIELSSNFRLATTFPSGTIASPERALPVETTSLVLYAKAGQS